MTAGTIFQNGGWLAQLACVLLILGVMSEGMRRLRIGVAAAALAMLAYAVSFSGNGMLAFWSAVLLGANLLQLGRLIARGRGIRFDVRDEALRTTLMPDLPRPHARALIDQGNWIAGRAGEQLVKEDTPVSHLFFLHEGGAEVSLGGQAVGKCRPGDLIGDATALDGTPATGTVTLAEQSRFWCIEAPRLREYLAGHPELRSGLERRVNESLRAKLEAANQRLAET